MTDGEAAGDLQLLTVCAPSAAGQIAAISGFLDQRSCYIGEFAQFDDPLARQFFARVLYRPSPGKSPSLQQMRDEFRVIADRFAMRWEMHEAEERRRVLIMVSKFDHCLADLLYRRRIGELRMAVTAVVSNHPDLQPLVDRHDARFIHLPVTASTKGVQEQQILKIIEDTGTELVVLARYMQVLSSAFCERLRGRIINIHHSFLPSFKGDRPYHQAHDRGVKLIGSTAHYVTADLDEGPIIAQAVQPVDHTYSTQRLIAVGRDSERVTLANAVQLHLERRVFLNGNKTVVLR